MVEEITIDGNLMVHQSPSNSVTKLIFCLEYHNIIGICKEFALPTNYSDIFYDFFGIVGIYL